MEVQRGDEDRWSFSFMNDGDALIPVVGEHLEGPI